MFWHLTMMFVLELKNITAGSSWRFQRWRESSFIEEYNPEPVTWADRIDHAEVTREQASASMEETEHLIGRAHTHIFLVARRVAQLFHMFLPMRLHWLKAWWIKSACVSRIANSTLAPQSFLHVMSRPPGPAWTSLYFLLTGDRIGDPSAAIPTAVAGLAEWLNGHRSQIMSPTLWSKSPANTRG